ncbi:CoA pyrophosphatase [uncultured Ferrovibrio sp.]|jgi:8-oxo-dGTP pyrophosphatase MutT (NUDIX family)|uniref:CoA pyrophosphatase n=1 Tax=uncultured Ferrovibrio sp. TaxID=1576913 RepID=UPI0026134E3F|nr:CoA pyrophosphatase [uncultured Ferrovibrio sp.]
MSGVTSTIVAATPTLDELRRRLQPVPPLSAIPREYGAVAKGDFQLNPHFRPTRSGLLVPAAVLVPVVGYEGGERVILTKRTAHLSNHAGQISFPGGRIDPEDPDVIATALRETEEEIGLDRSHVSVLGALDPYMTGTGFVVVPVVGLVRPGFTLIPQQHEVEEVFEVPFEFLMDRRNHQRHKGVFNGVERHWWAMPYNDKYIWGATAGMLRNLHDLLHGDLTHGKTVQS